MTLQATQKSKTPSKSPKPDISRRAPYCVFAEGQHAGHYVLERSPKGLEPRRLRGRLGHDKVAQHNLEVRPQLDKHVVGPDVSVRNVTPVQESQAVEKLLEGRHQLRLVTDPYMHYVAVRKVAHDDYDFGSFTHLEHLYNVGLGAVSIGAR